MLFTQTAKRIAISLLKSSRRWLTQTVYYRKFISHFSLFQTPCRTDGNQGLGGIIKGGNRGAFCCVRAVKAPLTRNYFILRECA